MGIKTRPLCLLIIALSLIGSTGCAKSDIWSRIAERPDVTIAIDPKTQLRTAKFNGGVEIVETAEGGIVAIDKSKNGAVMCSWKIYSHIKNILDLCSPEINDEYAALINDSVDQMNQFIIRNSLMPTTIEDLHKAQEEDRKKHFGPKTVLSDLDVQKICDTSDFYRMAKKLRSVSKEEYSDFIQKSRESLKNSMSIERPPVMNPCL